MPSSAPLLPTTSSRTSLAAMDNDEDEILEIRFDGSGTGRKRAGSGFSGDGRAEGVEVVSDDKQPRDSTYSAFPTTPSSAPSRPTTVSTSHTLSSYAAPSDRTVRPAERNRESTLSTARPFSSYAIPEREGSQHSSQPSDDEFSPISLAFDPPFAFSTEGGESKPRHSFSSIPSISAPNPHSARNAYAARAHASESNSKLNLAGGGGREGGVSRFSGASESVYSDDGAAGEKEGEKGFSGGRFGAGTVKSKRKPLKERKLLLVALLAALALVVCVVVGVGAGVGLSKKGDGEDAGEDDGDADAEAAENASDADWSSSSLPLAPSSASASPTETTNWDADPSASTTDWATYTGDEDGSPATTTDWDTWQAEPTTSAAWDDGSQQWGRRRNARRLA
ncbi:hypothetical protein JCM10213_006435 [Rhodosporidiobolus nylandii]